VTDLCANYDPNFRAEAVPVPAPSLGGRVIKGVRFDAFNCGDRGWIWHGTLNVNEKGLGEVPGYHQTTNPPDESGVGKSRCALILRVHGGFIGFATAEFSAGVPTIQKYPTIPIIGWHVVEDFDSIDFDVYLS
jgi:hypothetical protein